MVRPDTYATLNDAEAYLSLGLGDEHDAWFEATEERKYQALESATRLMLRLPWKGLKATVGQRLWHPIAGEDEIPQDLVDACTLTASALLDQRRPEEEYMSVGRSGERYGPVSESRDTSLQAPHFVAGIPSLEAWRLIRPYIMSDGLVNIMRVD